MITTRPFFRRDRFTWLAYALLAYFSYMQAVLGPLTPFLREALDLNYTVAGMHLSALSVGAVLGGLAAEYMLACWGRQRVLWSGGAGMSLGGLLLATALSPVITISGTFLIGLCGVLVMIIGQAGLSDQHGAARAVALAEGSLAS
ncbi:MAG: MFS transporter, partial [Anaerolineae bacterium]|nr:MFS transporter [Anaerolineae bacterium]